MMVLMSVDIYQLYVSIVLKSRTLSLLKTPGPAQTCTGFCFNFYVVTDNRRRETVAQKALSNTSSKKQQNLAPSLSFLLSGWDKISCKTRYISRVNGLSLSSPLLLGSQHICKTGFRINQFNKLTYVSRVIGVWGGVVVKALCYQSDGPGLDSRWCHWIFQ